MTKEFNLKTSINKGFYNYHKTKSTAASWSRERQDRIEVYFWRTRFLSGPWLNVLLIAGYRQLYCYCPDPSLPNAYEQNAGQVTITVLRPWPFTKFDIFCNRQAKMVVFNYPFFWGDSRLWKDVRCTFSDSLPWVDYQEIICITVLCKVFTMKT